MLDFDGLQKALWMDFGGVLEGFGMGFGLVWDSLDTSWLMFDFRFGRVCSEGSYRNPRAASLRPAERHNTRGSPQAWLNSVSSSKEIIL